MADRCGAVSLLRKMPQTVTIVFRFNVGMPDLILI